MFDVQNMIHDFGCFCTLSSECKPASDFPGYANIDHASMMEIFDKYLWNGAWKWNGME